MMKRAIVLERRVAWAFTLLLLIPSAAFAAGYLQFTTGGSPYRWIGPISYKLDSGNLGPITKGDESTSGTADFIVRQAMDAWETLPGSTVTFTSAGNTGADINNSNLAAFVNLNGTSCPTPDFVVVYDDTGDIFTDIFGSSADNILGLASPSVVSDGLREITCGFALLNGLALSDGGAGDQQQLLYTLMHELGHGLNLEHSQVNGDLISDGNSANDQFIPLMYPFIPNDLTAAMSGGSGGMKLDDQFSFLTIYNQTQLNSEGSIQGFITDKTGKGILGVNVLCYDKNNPEQNVVSWISDAVLDGKGEYVCGHLPAGEYQVKIEPITLAINSWTQGTPPFIPVEFFNGADESFNPDIDSLSDKADITVGTSEVKKVNIILNENGRITSTKKISSTIQAGGEASLEYLIYVPKSVTKATFKLDSTPTTADVDLYGRCNTAFSLSSEEDPIINPSAPEKQQAQFAGTSQTGNETVVLDKSSSPKIDNCDYHVLLFNYDSSSATYDLTVTLEGQTPKLKADFVPTRSVQSNGETLVSVGAFEAQDDQFTVNSISFSDDGIQSISNVSKVSVYSDENNNGSVDSEDILLSQTSDIDVSARTFTVSKLDFFIDEDQQKQVLITYDIPTTSSSIMIAFLMIGLLTMAFVKVPKKSYMVLAAAMLFLGRCSGSSSSDFNPSFQSSSQIDATASGFGDQFTVQVGKPQSVKQFFE